MKKVYITPEITVVTFRMELGFQNSPETSFHNQKFGDFNWSRMDGGSSHATSNETFTDYSDKYGNATAGKWE